MSKCNSSDSKAGDNLAESNQFTLKGDDEIYEIYSSPRLDSYKVNVESNKKVSTRSNSRRSIKISNLTNFSFRKYNSDDQEMKNEDKINITDNNNFQKVNIIPVQGKSNSIVKITLTKTKKSSNKKTNENNTILFPSNEIKEEINNIINNKNEQITNLNNEQNTIIKTTNQNQEEKSDSNSNENINEKELENKIDKNSNDEAKSENRSIEPSLELDFEYDSKESEKRSLTYENNNIQNEIPFDNKISVEKEIPINELNLNNNSNEKNQANKEENNKESEIVTEPMREEVEESKNIQNSKINEPKSIIDIISNTFDSNISSENEENNNYINNLNKLNNKDKNEIDKIDEDNKKKELSITHEVLVQNNNNLNNEINTSNKNENSKEIEISDINFQNAAMDIDSEVENFHKEKVQNENEDENANANANVKDDIKTSLNNKINNNNNDIDNNNRYENKNRNDSMNNEIYIECKNFLTQIFDYESIKKGKEFTSNFQIDINKDQKIEEKFQEIEKTSNQNNEEKKEKMLVETEKVCCEEEKTEIKKEENIEGKSEEKIEKKNEENFGEEERKEKEILNDIHYEGKSNERSKILEKNESCHSEEKEKEKEKEIKKQKEEGQKKENINLESKSKNMAIQAEKNKNDIFEIIEIKEEIEAKDEKSDCKIKKDKEEEKGIKKEIEIEKDIKKEKINELNVKEEDLNVNDKKDEKNNINIFDKDFFEKMKQQIKNEIYDDLINNGPLSPKSKPKPKKLKKESDEKNESDSSEEDENKSKSKSKSKKKIKNKEEEKDKTLLGKKRERPHLFEIDNSIKINYISDIIKTSEIYFDKDNNSNLVNNEGINENSDSSNNEVDEAILKLLESCAFKCLYEKIISKSFNSDNDLDRKIREIIKAKGFSNVVATLKYYKKNQILSSKVKEKINNNESESDKKSEKNPKEFHYNLLNDFYYRYKCINMKNNIQKYVCCAKDCNGLAELNLDEKKFGIIQNHSISPKFHIKYNDDKPIKFMKKRKLEEMHIKKNDNNDKFHMEWFK